MKRLVFLTWYMLGLPGVDRTTAFTSSTAASCQRCSRTGPDRRTQHARLDLQKRSLTDLYSLNATYYVQDMRRQYKELRREHKSVLIDILSPNDNHQGCHENIIEPGTEDAKHIVTRDSYCHETSIEARKNGISDLWQARMLLIGAAALYGTNFSLVKLLGDEMPVGVSSTLRFGLGALATAPWLLKDLQTKDGALTAAGLGFEVGLWNSIGYVAQAVGLDTTPAAESAFICSLAVVTVPILDFISGKRLLSRQWIGAFLAVVGVAFLELGGNLTSETMTTDDLLTLIQPFAFGVGFWRMEQAMNKFPDQASRMTASQLLAVFMASTVYCLYATDTSTLQGFPWMEWLTNPSLLLSLFWTGIITTALTIYMENRAMKTLSAAETTLIFSTEPLWGTAFAATVMGEELGFNVALGAIFILAACIYSNLGLVGLSNLMKTLSFEDTLSTRFINMESMRRPNIFGKEWTWLVSSSATTLCWWRVAASNIPVLQDVTDLLEDIAEIIL